MCPTLLELRVGPTARGSDYNRCILSGMAKTQFADHELRRRAIEHVVYEFANLLCAHHYSIHGNAPWRTNADNAFLLGYRKLGDFLLNEYPRRHDDVLALDYLPVGSTRAWDLP